MNRMYELVNDATKQIIIQGDMTDCTDQRDILTKGRGVRELDEEGRPTYTIRPIRRRFAIEGVMGYAEEDSYGMKVIGRFQDFNTIQEVFDFVSQYGMRPVGVRVLEYDLEAGPHDQNGMHRTPCVWPLKSSETLQAWRKVPFDRSLHNNTLYLLGGEIPADRPDPSKNVDLPTK